MKRVFFSAVVLLQSCAMQDTGTQGSLPVLSQESKPTEELNDRAARALFLELQDEGTIVYEGEDDDTGQSLYTLYFEECTIEYAHEAEVLEFIKTGTFEYNDFLNTK